MTQPIRSKLLILLNSVCNSFLHQPACGRLKPGLVQIWLRLEESLFALSADSMRAFDIDFAESLRSVDCSEEVQKSQMTSSSR